MKSVINYRTKIVSDYNLVEEARLYFVFNDNEGKTQSMQINTTNWNEAQKIRMKTTIKHKCFISIAAPQSKHILTLSRLKFK